MRRVTSNEEVIEKYDRLTKVDQEIRFEFSQKLGNDIKWTNIIKN